MNNHMQAESYVKLKCSNPSHYLKDYDHYI